MPFANTLRTSYGRRFANRIGPTGRHARSGRSKADDLADRHKWIRTELRKWIEIGGHKKEHRARDAHMSPFDGSAAGRAPGWPRFEPVSLEPTGRERSRGNACRVDSLSCQIRQVENRR